MGARAGSPQIGIRIGAPIATVAAGIARHPRCPATNGTANH